MQIRNFKEGFFVAIMSLMMALSVGLAAWAVSGLHDAASRPCPRRDPDAAAWASENSGRLFGFAIFLHFVTAFMAFYTAHCLSEKKDSPGGQQAVSGARFIAPLGGAVEVGANLPARQRRQPNYKVLGSLVVLFLVSILAPNVIGETCYTYGRILPNPDGLNTDNLWFQTSGQFGAAMCRLDIGMVKNCALFPGQVIVAKGTSNGKVFSASEIFTGAPPRQVELALPEKDTLHILAACGPYNLAGESQPEPLKDFIGYIIDTKPDLVIFMGPFVDETLARNEEFMNETTFENQFKSVMHFIFAQIPENLHIPIIVVPSAGQLVGMPVYPVARFTMADCVENAVAFAKSDVTRLVTFIPEPALLNINGVIVGLTSTDILSHLNQHELRWRCNGQLADTAGHMLLQQSFYPLYPSMIPSDTIAQKKFAKITYQPHLLIAPSELPAFARFVAGTICVNPEKLGQTDSGGCFTRIFIRTADDYHSDAAARIAADVIRI